MNGDIAHDALEMVEYRDSPAVHLFGDSGPALERMRRTATAAGCRILSAVLVSEQPRPFDDCAANAAALIELDGAAGDAPMTGLLDWAQREAEAGARRSVVAAPFALVDLVAAHAPHIDVDHLCGADESARMSAIRHAGRPGRSRFDDIGRDDGSLILQQLSEDVGRIAAILASLSEDEAAAKEASEPEAGEPGIDAALIRSMIRARRLRDQYFRSELFADPAWDMLLDLMAARLEKNRVAVSSLCIAAAVPATTALRWIKALTDRGLLVRSADPQDGRRVYIELSDETARALGAYLRAVQRISQVAV